MSYSDFDLRQAKQLAGIDGFELFDRLLSQAMDRVRFDGEERTRSLALTPKGNDRGECRENFPNPGGRLGNPWFSACSGRSRPEEDSAAFQLAGEEIEASAEKPLFSEGKAQRGAGVGESGLVSGGYDRKLRRGRIATGPRSIAGNVGGILRPY